MEIRQTTEKGDYNMRKTARQRLSGVYFYSFIVWLVYMYVTNEMGFNQVGFGDYTISIPTLADLFPDTILISIVWGLIYLFIILPLGASMEWFFLDIADSEKPSWRTLLSVFTNQNYMRFFVASLLILIFLFLWSLLLLVPGIIKSFSYSQTFRLMRENPEMGALEAITESRKRMNGIKTELFILQLSFIVWLIVPIIVLITGIVMDSQAISATADILFFIVWAFIGPYFQTANAVFYIEQIRKADWEE